MEGYKMVVIVVVEEFVQKVMGIWDFFYDLFYVFCVCDFVFLFVFEENIFFDSFFVVS